MQAVIIVSGGMDSVTMLHEYKDSIEHAITFDYGSKHNHKEIECAKYHCNLLGIDHTVIPLSFIGQHFKSSLLKSGGDIPDGHYEDTTMRDTVVPFRNGIMLSIAVGFAESNELSHVLLANHAGDHAIYPDCRKDFIDMFKIAARLGTYNGVHIAALYNTLSKRDVALKGGELGIDYNTTWSCYKGGELHCGTCGTCVERREALEGFDNTEYRD